MCLAKVVAVFIHETRLPCNYAWNADKTTFFPIIFFPISYNMLYSTNYSLIIFIDSENTKKYGKNSLRNPKNFVPAMGPCAIGGYSIKVFKN